MPTIIRDRNAVLHASLEDLNHTYRELRGEPAHPGFKDRAAAQVQVQMAIMAAEQVVAHAGVPVGSEPVAKTVAELGHNPYKEGTISHRLHDEIAAQAPIARRPKKAEAPADPANKRVVIRAVRATFAGTSRPQAGSVRRAVLDYVQKAPNATATVEALEEHFQQPVRGYLQKLIEKNHLTIVEDAQ